VTKRTFWQDFLRSYILACRSIAWAPMVVAAWRGFTIFAVLFAVIWLLAWVTPLHRL